MKYEKEVNEFLREALYQPWMDEDDYDKVVENTLQEMETTKEKLSKDIETGVKNGFTVHMQLEMIKVFKSNKRPK